MRGRKNRPRCRNRHPPMLHQHMAHAHGPPVLHCQRLGTDKCPSLGLYFHAICSRVQKDPSFALGGSKTISSPFSPYRSSPLKASAVVMELCFLVNNDSFHSRTAFSPAAELDGAEGKEKERGGDVLLQKAALSTLSSTMKSTVVLSHTGVTVFNSRQLI